MERYVELGAAEGHGLTAFEMYKVAKGNESRALLAFEQAGLDTSSGRDLGVGWLESAAREYNISTDIKDYVIAPVITFPTSLPNRNGVAFPLKAMSRFDPELGQLGYETWRRKPTHAQHQNSDLTIAKGVVFDVRMTPMSNTNNRIWKHVCLAGFDRTRDPALANKILTGECAHYSMGASVGEYECAVCGHKPNKDSIGCEHFALNRREMKTYHVPNRGNVLAHYICDFVRGIELSAVWPTPAWASAETPTTQLISLRD